MTRIRARRCGVRIPVGIRDFSLHQNVQLLQNGHRGNYPAVERPGRDADYSPSPGTQFKSEQKCTSALPVCLHGVGRDSYSVAMVIRPDFV